MRGRFFAIASVVVLGACSGSTAGSGSGASSNAADSTSSPADTPAAPDDAAGAANATPSAALPLGSVTNVTSITCPSGPPAGSTCQKITITDCPGIPSDTLDATVAVLAPTGAVKGTVVHFSGSGGEGFEKTGSSDYQAAGLRQVFVGWKADWEKTTSAGIKAGACRPATAIQWVFDTIHGASRTAAFCGQGMSGGAGQLGYALAHYGMSGVFDYVNELSGPPFARIDIGCNGDAQPTANVCGVADTLRLPMGVATWENIPPPLTCGSTNVPPSELDRWKSDSISVGGVYNYPKTDVQFFDCTNQATAVTAMSQFYMQQILQAEGSGALVGYHCFSAADGCVGESLGTGAQQAVDSLVATCKPRH